jgi:hypothetical protein
MTAASLLVVLIAGSAFAAPVYPVSARLTLAPDASQHCLKVAGGERTDCSIIEQVRAAFSATAARMFLSAPNPNLELVLTVTDAEIFETVSGGLEFDVRARVRILTPGGELLDEITAVGRVPVSEQSAVTLAAGVAAENAARDFDLQYSRSQAVADWLVRSKVAPAAAVNIPERSDKLVFFSFGAGFVQGGGDSDVALAPSVRLSGSFRWLVLQAMYSRFPPFAPTTSTANLHTNDLGFEAGAVIRFTPAVELHVGPGVHYLFGTGALDNGALDETNVSSFTKVSPTAFASLSVAFLPFRNGARFFAGLDARAYLFTAVDMPQLYRRVPAANTSFGLFIGTELPWGSKERRAP